MTAEREFDRALLLVGLPMVLLLAGFITAVILTAPPLVSSPGGAAVPAVPVTAGTSSP